MKTYSTFFTPSHICLHKTNQPSPRSFYLVLFLPVTGLFPIVGVNCRVILSIAGSRISPADKESGHDSLKRFIPIKRDFFGDKSLRLCKTYHDVCFVSVVCL